MEPQIIKIESIQHITHDVLQVKTEKPEQIQFTPGQAAEISINIKGWQDEKRPFTFTSLPADHHLEFTIKTYPERMGVTNELLRLKKGETLIIHDIFGAIAYKSEGTFIAGGAGVTPFISIFRYLKSINEIGGNKLIFANKTKKDIILAQEFNGLLGPNFINILSDENIEGIPYGFITENFLEKHISDLKKYVYLCGPPAMMSTIEKELKNLNIESTLIIQEEM